MLKTNSVLKRLNFEVKCFFLCAKVLFITIKKYKVHISDCFIVSYLVGLTIRDVVMEKCGHRPYIPVHDSRTTSDWVTRCSVDDVTWLGAPLTPPLRPSVSQRDNGST